MDSDDFNANESAQKMVKGSFNDYSRSFVEINVSSVNSEKGVNK